MRQSETPEEDTMLSTDDIRTELRRCVDEAARKATDAHTEGKIEEWQFHTGAQCAYLNAVALLDPAAAGFRRAMSTLDELDNDTLREELNYTMGNAIWAEEARVKALIGRLVLTGEDLTYWYERERILAAAIADLV